MIIPGRHLRTLRQRVRGEESKGESPVCRRRCILERRLTWLLTKRSILKFVELEVQTHILYGTWVGFGREVWAGVETWGLQGERSQGEDGMAQLKSKRGEPSGCQGFEELNKKGFPSR